MKIFFFPPTSPFNPYIDNIVSGLEQNGAVIVNKGKSSKYSKLTSSFSAMLKGTDIYHFNWIENKSYKDSLYNRLVCAAILLWFSLMRLSGGKLAWTMHNKESHFATGDKTFHHAFLKKLISRMDMILVHAGETKDILVKEYGFPQDRICYVPHGSYIDSTKPKPTIEEHNTFTLLAFGMVNRYKNVPLLIRAFNELNLDQAELLIYGKLDNKDAELEKQINDELSQSQHVKYVNAFIPDEQIGDLFRAADVVVLPYDKVSMINSGAAVMAMSEGKPIIVSLFGAIKDIRDRDFVYSYDYSTEEDHLQALKNTITRVYSEWQKDKNAMVVHGMHAYKYAIEELSWNTICFDIIKKYEEILSK